MKISKSHRFAVVRARFNGQITQALLDGARRAFADAGVRATQLEICEVPGSFELPLAALWLARSGKFAAIVCLGCVIRGETPHFDYVAGESARGIAAAALETGIPIIFGVLTVETAEQAWARAGREDGLPADHLKRSATQARPLHRPPRARGNKGYEAAQAAVEMACLRDRLQPKRR